MDERMEHTMRYAAPRDHTTAREALTTAFAAMREKGYDAVNQIVGYLLSGDPTYITGYKNARYLMMRVERDELIEELVRVYMASGDSQ
ncbi:MAG: IreB family regulatory phosphoprotein [Clostridiales bacterium]|nr:IreB family regulatory phosphoprotein [Clostridiales bacterium]